MTEHMYYLYDAVHQIKHEGQNSELINRNAKVIIRAR